MPFERKSSHFSALEAAMGDRIMGGTDAFMNKADRLKFQRDAEIVRATSKSKSKAIITTPQASDNKTYIVDGPCQQCPLWAGSHTSANNLSLWRSGIYGRGTGKNGIYIVGEAVTAFELVDNTPFSGPIGSILSRSLAKVGIVEEDCFITNIVKCRPDNNRVPTAAEYTSCHDMHFEHDLPYGFYDGLGTGKVKDEWDPNWRPKLVIVMGRIALQRMMKMSKITENRGIFFDYTFIDTPIKFIATWHPSKLLMSPDLLTDFEGDLSKAKRFVFNKSGSTAPPPITKALVSTRDNYMEWMNFLLSESEDNRLSVDIETSGLDFKTAEIASIAFSCTRNKKSYGISFLTSMKNSEGHPDSNLWWKLDLHNRESVEYLALKTLLETSPLTFQNGDFDVKFFWEVGINAVNNCDTMDAHLMLNEKGSHALAYLVKGYIGESDGYKAEFRDTLGDKSAYHLAEPISLTDYNIDDTYYTQILRDMFLPMIEKEGLSNLFWKHAMPLQRTLTRMSYRGMRVDRKVLMELASQNRTEIQKTIKELYSAVGEFNFSSAPAVGKLLYETLKLPVYKTTGKEGNPSTDKDVLRLLSAEHPVPAMILKIRQLSKQNSTYLDGDNGLPKKNSKAKTTGILKYLDENDRVHTHFFPWGTVSGRLSAVAPNLLNIPKKSIFRDLFIPSDGYVFVDGDYAQAELRVLAYLCGDPALIEAVNSSDMHSKVVQDLLGLSIDDPEYSRSRTVAKNINFGKVYGAGPKRLVDQLKYDAGIDLHLSDAKIYHAKWDAMYPGVKVWGEAQHTLWRMNLELVSLFGRKMRFPDLTDMHSMQGQRDAVEQLQAEKDRLSTNFNPQSSVGDATNRTLFLVDAEIEERYGKWTPENFMDRPAPILSVHDEVLLEVPEDEADACAKMLYEIMLIPLPGLNIPLRVEMDIRKSWGTKGTPVHL